MNFKLMFFFAALILFSKDRVVRSHKIFSMDQRLTIITLGVHDLKTATDFYEKKFGWIKSGSSNGDISFFHLNGVELALFERNELAKDAAVDPAGNGFRAFTLAYNTKSEKEVDEIFEVLGEKRVTIQKKPAKASWGGYSGYVSDLDGNLWEIAYNPFLPLDEKGNTRDH